MNLSCVVKGREARRVRLDGEQFTVLESVIGNEYTKALGFELAANLEGLGITVSPVGRFALERLRRRGFDEAERHEPGFWDRVTKRAAGPGALWEGCGFDTVIVDEGQDFGKHEWAIEKHAVKFDLGRPYRCTPGIQALADAYLGKNSGFEAVAGWDDVGENKERSFLSFLVE